MMLLDDISAVAGQRKTYFASFRPELAVVFGSGLAGVLRFW